ncbi:MAG: class I SAM-dependent RNA methyltransferase [Bryobacteraceae bacterium]
MVEPQTNIELDIEKLVYGGDGLARPGGHVVFTPFVLPGERVEVSPQAERGGLLRAKLARVITPAAGRVEAPCPYFGRCGGCHHQHAAYDLQLHLKREILAETLRRVGGFDPPAAIATVSGEPWGYRNRAQFHIDGGRIGFREAQSHKLCAIEQCPISSPAVNRTLARLIEMMRDSRWPRFIRSLEVFTNETSVQFNVLETERPVARRFFEWCAESIPGAGEGSLDYNAAGFTYRVGGKSFFQVNRFLADQLAETALADATGHAVLDLYAGVGLFSLPLARRFTKVTAVESGAGAASDLHFNAERAGLKVEVVRENTESFLQRLTARPDFVLADPPRSGLGKTVVKALAALEPPRITIVACDPSTLARDLGGLLAAGYVLERIAIVDLFPQTFHIESVASLRQS